MKRLSVLVFVLASLVVGVSAGCKKEPCEAALGNMKKIAESMPEGKAGKAPTAEEEKEFLAGCAKWPEEIKTCMADASDEKSAEACFKKMMQIEAPAAATPAAEEAKPAEGEAKPAEGAAKPAEGEAKPQ